jgi:asparagine synthase (glutamine-hydrolysing)
MSICGICGVANLDGTMANGDIIRKMTDVIAHRGPDGEGQFLDGPVGLGHRRLAILDLSSAGAQPMANDQGNLYITYNGEVYNHQELRVELEAKGFQFQSHSDTEVVLKAYEAWGEACVGRFNGMFAFAIWNRSARQLFLARDRYGIKPLYLHATPRRFAFASEMKALLAGGGVERRLDPVALREYFTFQNVFSDRTLLEGIRILPPGHTLTLELGTGRTKTAQYWDYRFKAGTSSFEAAADRLRLRFQEAVKRQIVSDVTVGAHLSGGMDSGSIVAVASRSIANLMTFTGGFDVRGADPMEATFDEREPAEAMASKFGVEHYEMVMHAGDMRRILPTLVWHLEDLRVGMSWPNFYIDRLASRFVKVALSGTGGDELFAGYPWRYRVAAGARTRKEFADRYFSYWQRLVPEAEHGSFFTVGVMDATRDAAPRRAFDAVLADDGLPEDAPMERALYFELRTFLHGLLVMSDKLSMAHSLELRVPFLDNEVVDLALTIPTAYKLAAENNGLEVDENILGHKEMYLRRSNEGKRVLRHAMRGLVPDEILDRTKQGFSPPDGTWFRTRSMPYLRETLLSKEALGRGYIQEAAVRRVLDEHANGVANHRLLLWSLLCFEWWCRLFLDEEAPPTINGAAA